eukprot:TRINITY_DN367_c0_g1_i1.p1 TRINITY_DN367_c0_g1~~TRINITY_DN367_c0_g1_i1.p1  ORF type:complete len:251 (-),score=71.16 TRINITY_DN367_c0_g1_i1:110-823(-)
MSNNSKTTDGKKLVRELVIPAARQRTLWQSYLHSLETRPLYTKAMTSGVLNAAEEFCAQLLGILAKMNSRSQGTVVQRAEAAINRRKPSPLEKLVATLQATPAALISIDYSKVVKFGIYGFCVNGPLGHFLYKKMEDFFPGDRAALVLIKFIFTNLFIIPFQTAVYLSALGLINNDNLTQIKKRLHQNFAPIIVTTWKYFPAIQLLTFTLLPPALWLPFFNFLGFIYGVYINSTSSK